MACGSWRSTGMRGGYLPGSLSRPATQRQMDVLAAFVAAGGSVPDAAKLVGIRPSTVKRHLADLRARSGLTGALGRRAPPDSRSRHRVASSGDLSE